MPTPIATYVLKTTVPGTGALTTPSFTPANGEDVVVKLGTWDTGSPMGAPTGGSQTFTSRVINAPGGFNEWCAIYTATISGSPGSMTISSTPSVSSQYSMCVERWPAGSLAASPVTSSNTGFSAPATGTITPTAGTSAISWVAGDVQSVDPATRAYLNSGTDEGLRDGHVGSNGVEYYGLQPASGTSSQSYGLSAPTGQTFVIAAIEILATGGSTPIVDPAWVPHLLVPPGRISPAGFWVPWRGDAAIAGAVQITLPDVGSSSEALTVAAVVALADAGAGTESLTSAVTLALTDTGAGVDSFSVAASVGLADTGAAVDTVTATVAVALTDTGSASDALSMAATAALPDSGSGSEALIVSATIPLADTGSSSEALDNGTGTNKTLTDTAAAADSLTVTVTLSLADAAAAAEALTLAAAVVLADAAAIVEAAAVTAAADLGDSATAGQALTPTASLALADAGHAADSGSGSDSSNTPKSLSDTASATERIHARVVRPNTGTTTRPFTGITLWP